MSDILLTAGDIALSRGATGNTAQVTLATEDEAVAQHLSIRLRHFLGEWELNTLEGIPFFRDVFVKAPDLGLVRDIFRSEIINTPGVAEVNEIAVTINTATREALLTFRCTFDSGAVLDFTDPFIIEI